MGALLKIDRTIRKRRAVTTGYEKVLRKNIRAEIEAQQEINRQKAKLREAKNGK
jgi:hypothetical protein